MLRPAETMIQLTHTHNIRDFPINDSLLGVDSPYKGRLLSCYIEQAQAIEKKPSLIAGDLKSNAAQVIAL